MSAADLYGPWVDSDWESGLIERLRDNWNVPFEQLTDAALALFLRQHTADSFVLPEAQRRLASGLVDDTELYDGELAEAVARFAPQT